MLQPLRGFHTQNQFRDSDGRSDLHSYFHVPGTTNLDETPPATDEPTVATIEELGR